MEFGFLKDVVIIFGLSIVVIYICYRVQVPAIVGFFLTGILVGPHGFGFINEVNGVRFLADIGIVFLLFTIGIESSLKNLLQVKKIAVLGGTLQIVLTVLVTFLAARFVELPYGKAVFIGFLVSLSSTALVLRILQRRAEFSSTHGKTCLAILTFQDIAIVPMILVTPFLAGEGISGGASLVVLLFKIAGIIIFTFVSAKWLVPRLLYYIAHTRSQELFLMGIVFICLAIAWLTSSAGLSLALGSFLAGLIISESEYSHQAIGNIIPLRDAFASFFFVSVGMLLDSQFFIANILKVILAASGTIMLKTMIVSIIVLMFGYSFRTAVISGLALSQIGEFSFILSEVGREKGLLDKQIYQLFLSVSVLTMMITPFIMTLAPRIVDFLSFLPLPQKLKLGSLVGMEYAAKEKLNHLIIVGFGINGRNVAKAAKEAGVDYIIIETNPDTVKKEKLKGENIFYGDATQEAVLMRASIKKASVLVVVIAAPAATNRITEIARRLNREIHIIIRTRFVGEMNLLYKLGASEVIPEEFETSVEIFKRVLLQFNVPDQRIKELVEEVRSNGYQLFKDFNK